MLYEEQSEKRLTALLLTEDEMGLARYVAGGIGGMILALLGLFHASIVVFGSSNPSLAALTFFGGWGAGIMIAAHAPSAAKAWRALLLTSAVLLYLLPVSGFLCIAVNFMGEHPVATGSGAAGVAYIPMVLAVMGFLGGRIVWAIGSRVGRDKKPDAAAAG